MLSEFNNEVLLKGPNSVLPQHLNTFWLKRLQKIAEDFLDSNFSLDECKDPQDIADPILSVCVYEILRHQHTDSNIVPIEEVLEKMAIYAISIIMEAVNRESDIGLEPPDLDNIFSIKRIASFKKINPEFVATLEKACIIRVPDKGWFDNIKEKLLSKIFGGVHP